MDLPFLLLCAIPVGLSLALSAVILLRCHHHWRVSQVGVLQCAYCGKRRTRWVRRARRARH